jgi:hypothetical protein
MMLAVKSEPVGVRGNMIEGRTGSWPAAGKPKLELNVLVLK